MSQTVELLPNKCQDPEFKIQYGKKKEKRLIFVHFIYIVDDQEKQTVVI
jgi:hypothetical protein